MPASTRRALLLVCLLLLSGCSMIRLGYETLPSLSHWYADRYLALDEAQHAILDRRFETLQQWHRREALPRYASLLRAARTEVADGVDAQALARWREQVAQAWEPLAERLAPGFAELALTLRADQIQRLSGRLDDGDAEARETMWPDGDAARERARLERVLKRVEFFFGRLNREQVRALRDAARALPTVEPQWLDERRARGRALVALLERIRRERPSQAEAGRWSREYLLSLWRSADPQRRAALAQGADAGDALSVRLLNDATPAQRAHLAERLTDWLDDLDRMIRR